MESLPLLGLLFDRFATFGHFCPCMMLLNIVDHFGHCRPLLLSFGPPLALFGLFWLAMVAFGCLLLLLATSCFLLPRTTFATYLVTV